LEFFLFLTPKPGEEGVPGRGLLLSADKQDPILRALIIFNMHSRPARESDPLFSEDGSVRTDGVKILKRTFSEFTDPMVRLIDQIHLITLLNSTAQISRFALHHTKKERKKEAYKRNGKLSTIFFQ
jgi:hypothetical protein